MTLLKESILSKYQKCCSHVNLALAMKEIDTEVMDVDVIYYKEQLTYIKAFQNKKWSWKNFHEKENKRKSLTNPNDTEAIGIPTIQKSRKDKNKKWRLNIKHFNLN